MPGQTIITSDDVVIPDDVTLELTVMRVEQVCNGPGPYVWAPRTCACAQGSLPWARAHADGRWAHAHGPRAHAHGPGAHADGPGPRGLGLGYKVLGPGCNSNVYNNGLR